MQIDISKISDFFGHRNPIYRILAKNDQIFYSAGADSMLVQWDLLNPSEGIMVAKTESPIYSLARHNKFIIMGLRNGSLHIMDSENNVAFKQLLISKYPIFSLHVFNKNLFIGTENGMLYILDLADFVIKHKVKVSEKSIRSIVILENCLFLGCSDHFIYKYGLDLKIHEKIEAHEASVFALATFNNHIISGGRDARIKKFTADLKIKNSIDAHWLHVKHLIFNPFYKYIMASTSMDKSIRLWDMREDKLLKVIDLEKYGGHSSSVNCGLWLDKNTFISCSDDRSIKAFKIDINITK